ncbi:MAG: cytochrome P450 [Paracoccaceae bacterium]|nr:cytochrome P450 [Paracoccaceae bacterium]
MADPAAHIPHQVRPPDPFAEARSKSGADVGTFHGEDLLMLLRWKDVRAAARDFEHFDSSVRGRVPIPPEDEIRPFRQLPIETNPPEHGRWKEIVLPYFRRPMDPAAKAEFECILASRVTKALKGSVMEMVRDFALPVQSASLAVLLDTDRDIAAEWQGWGLHAFRTDGKTDPAKAARFLEFIDRMLNRGLVEPDMGLFSALHDARFEERPLTRDEMRGICHLSLAGGRDTVINAIVGTLAHMAQTPEDLDRLRDEPSLIPVATEEIFRVLSPLPQIARVCPHGYEHGPLTVAPGDRAALCWAAANRDPEVFESPEELRIDRARNPHVAFGAGTHTCLGAPMARLLVRTLLSQLAERVERIEVLNSVARTNPFGTPYLFESFHARLVGRKTS